MHIHVCKHIYILGIYIYIRVFANLDIYIEIYVLINLYNYIYIRTYVYTYIYIYVWIYICLYIYTTGGVQLYIYIQYVCMDIYIYINIYIYTTGGVQFFAQLHFASAHKQIMSETNVEIDLHLKKNHRKRTISSSCALHKSASKWWRKKMSHALRRAKNSAGVCFFPAHGARASHLNYE